VCSSFGMCEITQVFFCKKTNRIKRKKRELTPALNFSKKLLYSNSAYTNTLGISPMAKMAHALKPLSN